MKNAPDPEAAAARMRREIERLSRLVGTLLEATSAEGDPLTRKNERLPIASLVKDIVQDCAFEAQAHHLRIETAIDSSAIIEGDPELLRRAIENVLRNAMRYSPKDSSVAVRLEDRQRQRSSHRLRPRPGGSRRNAQAHLRSVLPR